MTRGLALLANPQDAKLHVDRMIASDLSWASRLVPGLADHNSGKSAHTSKYMPWKLVTYVAFSDRQKAEAFERYLKSGSGHAFATKRLW